MAIDRETVGRVGRLARLSLTAADEASLAEELSRIVDLFDSIAAVDTTGVRPFVHPLDLTDVLADDVPGPTLDRDQALAVAPDADDGCFRVPPVLDGS